MHIGFGVSMILIFCFSQAFRDVYLGHVFQNVGFFAVILLAFIPSTLFFASWSLIRNRPEIPLLWKNRGVVLAMNVATAMAWTSYFFGLTHIVPSIVNTLHSGVAPLTVIAAAAAGLAIAGTYRVRRIEGLLLAGLGLTLAFLWWIVLSGQSGDTKNVSGATIAALFLLVVSGASITISHLLSKKLHDHGLGATTITASRYILIIIVAAGFLMAAQKPSGIANVQHGFILGAAAAILIALPLYILQVGLGHTPPFLAHILRALGPVFVFALEQFDSRLHYSAIVLIAILAYSAFAAAANIAHSLSVKSELR